MAHAGSAATGLPAPQIQEDADARLSGVRWLGSSGIWRILCVGAGDETMSHKLRPGHHTDQREMMEKFDVLAFGLVDLSGRTLSNEHPPPAHQHRYLLFFFFCGHSTTKPNRTKEGEGPTSQCCMGSSASAGVDMMMRSSK